MKLSLLLLFLPLLLLADDQLPDAPGKSTFIRVCGDCHGPEVVTGMGHDRPGWKDVVDDMASRGAKANEKELAEVVDYLTKAFPKKPR